MQKEQNSRGTVSPVLERIQREYAELLQSTPFSLQKLFSPDGFQFDEFCRDFSPHPQSDQLKKDAEAFGQRYGTWLDNSRHYINCAWYLYPTAHFERVLTITKNLSVGFYLNDVMGRDVFNSLTPEEQCMSRKMIENMALMDHTLYTAPDAHPMELANAEILREFRDHSPKEWFTRFLRLYCYHLDITHKDRNAKALGYVPGIHEYIDNRCYYAAVHHLILWIEYSSGQFLEWDLIMRTNFYQKLQRLHWVTAAFPALANDLFSFEYEVIDNGCDSNLVMVLILNDPELSLRQAVGKAGEIVRNLVLEIQELLRYIERETEEIRPLYPDLAGQLTIHLKGIVQFVQASWLWQATSRRYKRPGSIWKETMLVPKVSSSPV
jgi:hypothetical protein